MARTRIYVLGEVQIKQLYVLFCFYVFLNNEKLYFFTSCPYRVSSLSFRTLARKGSGLLLLLLLLHGGGRGGVVAAAVVGRNTAAAAGGGGGGGGASGTPGPGCENYIKLVFTDEMQKRRKLIKQGEIHTYLEALDFFARTMRKRSCIIFFKKILPFLRFPPGP